MLLKYNYKSYRGAELKSTFIRIGLKNKTKGFSAETKIFYPEGFRWVAAEYVADCRKGFLAESY